MKIWIQVKPRSRKEKVEILPDGSLRVFVKEPPVEGKANKAVVNLLARHFSVPQSTVEILSGASGKRKLVEIG
ncbi:MAG: DUF167 domain-containing protein [Deltaproteobacteria bacterium]|nr:DUF167 domain-containing protein [Deltaproteobacteria bacterium]